MTYRVRGDQAENMTTEISYPREDLHKEELNPSDVEDILERLHIGTLRRDELRKARESILSAGEEEAALDDQDMDDLYKGDDTRQSSKGSSRSSLQRHSSRTSGTSTGSGASGSSEDTRQSVRSSTSSSNYAVKSTSEMAIQTTIGRNPRQPELREYRTQEEDIEKGHAHERKLSTKDKMKRLFKRKSSHSQDGNANAVLVPRELLSLPQVFIVKYMGSRPTKGLWGSRHTRGPVEEVVDTVGQMPKGADLPLVCLMVGEDGLSMAPHKKNKIKSFRRVSIPIQYVSYGLQDTVYPRIFSFIMVKEMSSQSKKLECFVYACDSSKSARKLAACLAFAFKEYSERLTGPEFKFTVDVPIRHPEDDAKSTYDA